MRLNRYRCLGTTLKIFHITFCVYMTFSVKRSRFACFLRKQKHDKDKCPRRRNDRRSVDLFAVSGCATPPASNIQAGNSGCFRRLFHNKIFRGGKPPDGIAVKLLNTIFKPYPQLLPPGSA